MIIIIIKCEGRAQKKKKESIESIERKPLISL